MSNICSHSNALKTANEKGCDLFVNTIHKI